MPPKGKGRKSNIEAYRDAMAIVKLVDHDCMEVADAAKVRVTSEIVREPPSNVVYPTELRPGPRFPSPAEIDNIALRREISRLRQEREQQLAVQETADRLEAQLRSEREERAGLESAFLRLRHKLERKSIKYRIRRLMQVFSAAPAVARARRSRGASTKLSTSAER